jgi:hypothetical protein
VVVLDGKGETLASWIGDTAGAGCKQSAVSKFPCNLAALIRKSLRCTESVQELERRWRQYTTNLVAFDRFADRLEAMDAFERLRQICRRQAGDPQHSDERRNEFRIREFLARADGHGGELFTGRGRARFAREGEKLLVELADHPRSADLADVLFARTYAHGFDVPARSAEAIARLEQAAGTRAKPERLWQRIRRLRRLRKRWIKDMNDYRNSNNDPTSKQFIAASLGDARAAIALFSQPGYADHPDYQERLREAKRKLRQEEKEGAVPAG